MDPHQPRRFYLISHPRTTSNLLVRILALDDQPDVALHQSGALGGYFFAPASGLEVELGLQGKLIEEWSAVHRNQMKEKLQECFDNLEKYLEGAETDGKIAFVKEHGFLLIEPTARMALIHGRGSTREHPWTIRLPSKYGSELTRSPLNETLFADEFLRTWLPTFLIRHPALVFPSQYRAMKDLDVINPVQKDTLQFDMWITFRWIRSLYDYWSDCVGKFGVGIDGDRTWVNSLSINIGST
jgi:hypothetical protein